MAPLCGTGNGLDNVIVVQSAGRYRLRGEGQRLARRRHGSRHAEGGAGNDTLHGAAGADQLAGAMATTLHPDHLLDTVTSRAARGRTRYAARFRYRRRRHRRLVLNASGHYATGNDLDNTISGNPGLNFLSGGGGNDTISGGLVGNGDTLAGGTGDDTYDLIFGGPHFIVEAANEGPTRS